MTAAPSHKALASCPVVVSGQLQQTNPQSDRWVCVTSTMIQCVIRRDWPPGLDPPHHGANSSSSSSRRWQRWKSHLDASIAGVILDAATNGRPHKRHSRLLHSSAFTALGVRLLKLILHVLCEINYTHQVFCLCRCQLHCRMCTSPHDVDNKISAHIAELSTNVLKLKQNWNKTISSAVAEMKQ